MELLFRTLLPPFEDDGEQARALLAADGLTLDHDVDLMITARESSGALAACGCLARDVVKCVAVRASLRGEGVALPLMTELTAAAWERGHKDLFLYTKPANESLFSGCGFITLAGAPDALLMENNKQRLPRYISELAKLRRPGAAVAGLVMNCNPFTLGHRHLVETAARACDWVHLFVVKEDLSLFPYQDRLELVRAGCADIENLTVHPGSEYVLSRATFPNYFIKDAARIDKAYTGIDIQIFRNHIAPALGINRRFVGEEPLCAVTRRYNEDMAFWLSTPTLAAPPVELTIIPRLALGGEPISASQVRALWAAGDHKTLRTLVPPATYEYLSHRKENTA